MYISSFAHSLGYLRFYEDYGLLRSVKTIEDGIKEIQNLLIDPDIQERVKRREKMLSETIDVATFIADQCETYAKFSLH